jgi:hypothetical protein
MHMHRPRPSPSLHFDETMTAAAEDRKVRTAMRAASKSASNLPGAYVTSVKPPQSAVNRWRSREARKAPRRVAERPFEALLGDAPVSLLGVPGAVWPFGPPLRLIIADRLYLHVGNLYSG